MKDREQRIIEMICDFECNKDGHIDEIKQLTKEIMALDDAWNYDKAKQTLAEYNSWGWSFPPTAWKHITPPKQQEE